MIRMCKPWGTVRTAGVVGFLAFALCSPCVSFAQESSRTEEARASDPTRWRVAILEKGREFERFLEELAKRSKPQASSAPAHALSVAVRLDEAKLLEQTTRGSGPLKLKTLAAEVDATYVPSQRLQALSLQELAAYVTRIEVSVQVEADDAGTQAWLKRYENSISREFLKVVQVPVSFDAEVSTSALSKVDALNSRLASLENELKETRRERDAARQSRASDVLGEGQMAILREQERAKADALAARLAQVEKERDVALGEGSRLREELSVYQTPLGDLKKTIRGLELPLSLLPLTVVAFVLGLIAFYVNGVLGARRNAALQGGLERLGAALQQGLQARPQKSWAREGGQRLLDGEGSRALGSRETQGGTGQAVSSGSTRADVLEVLADVTASPRAAFACLEILARRGELSALETLLHCLPPDLRLRASASRDVQNARSAVGDRGGVNWGAALSDAIRLQLSLVEEFGMRLEALAGLPAGSGLRQDEAALRVAFEKRDEAAAKAALVVLPRASTVAFLSELDSPGAAWLFACWLEVERDATQVLKETGLHLTQGDQKLYDQHEILAQLARTFLEDVPQLASHLRSLAPGNAADELSFVRERLDEGSVGISDLFGLDAVTLGEILVPLEDEELANLCHALDPKDRSLLVQLLGPVRSETITAQFERSGNSRLLARDARRRGRELAKALVARFGSLLKEENVRKAS